MSNGSVQVHITGCITIDHTKDQFLDTAWKFLHKPPRHKDRIIAAANLIDCLTATAAPPDINIIGHGEQGSIHTGSGDVVSSDSHKFIGFPNSSQWTAQPNLIAIGTRPFSLCRLCACDTGAGPDGATLLSLMAQTINGPVEAPTGFLYCDQYYGFFLEPNATWLRATPQHQPHPIDPPKPYSTDAAMDTLTFKSPTGFFTIPITNVTALSMTPTGIHKFAPVIFAGAKAQWAATFVQFNKPFEQRAVPAAVVTGTFLVSFRRDDRDEQRAFRIYNNRMLQDVVTEDVYYYANVLDLAAASASSSR
jgi:hypothetical protein